MLNITHWGAVIVCTLSASRKSATFFVNISLYTHGICCIIVNLSSTWGLLKLWHLWEMSLFLCFILMCYYASNWKGRVIYCFSPPVCLSVCLSVTKSCPLYNLITVRDISTKLHTFVKHIQTTCHAQEPYLLHVYLSSYSPCNINMGILSTL